MEHLTSVLVKSLTCFHSNKHVCVRHRFTLEIKREKTTECITRKIWRTIIKIIIVLNKVRGTHFIMHIKFYPIYLSL